MDGWKALSSTIGLDAVPKGSGQEGAKRSGISKRDKQEAEHATEFLGGAVKGSTPCTDARHKPNRPYKCGCTYGS